MEKIQKTGEEFIKIGKTVDDSFVNQEISEQQLQDHMRKLGEL